MERAVKDRCDFEIGYRKAVQHYDAETDRLRKAVSNSRFEQNKANTKLLKREKDKDDCRTTTGN
jgi:hypothetical protein